MVQQVPSFYRRRVGDALVTVVSDGVLPFDLGVFANIAPEEVNACLADAFRRMPMQASLNCFVIERDWHTALVDTGGGGMAPSCGKLMENLRAAGYTPEAIDTVLITHLHPDHVGGAADAAGQAAFPNAILQVHQADIDFWVHSDMRERVPEPARVFFDMARAGVAAYAQAGRLKPFTGGEVFPGVQAVPLPGHTPGHSGYELVGDDETLLIWGDVFHVPEVQTRHPEATLGPFDVDQAQAAATRAAVLKRAVEEKLLVAGMHLHFPAFSHVVAHETGYGLLPEMWQPAL